MNDSPTFVSLYSGAGGLDLGFVQAGFRPLFANDIDGDALRTNARLIEKSAAALPHMTGASPAEYAVGSIRDITLPARDAADVLIGGPPCQGFSVAGRMDPDDPRSKHVFDFLGAVQRLNPEIFIMENVKALAVNERWSGVVTELRRRAHLLGYDTSLTVLDATEFGVPQKRERMFLIGSRSKSAPRFDSTDVTSPNSIRTTLADLPPWRSPGNDDVCRAIVTPAKNPVLRKSPWAGMLFNGQGRPLNLDSFAPTLPASMGGNRTPIIDQSNLDDPESKPWVVGYHKKLMNGGTTARRVPKRLRRITVQEAAAIQTFPADTDWQGPQSSKFRQIGNAVPPRLAYGVARKVLDHYEFKVPTSAAA